MAVMNGASLRQLSISAAVLIGVLALAGCTSAPDDGRIVTEGGTPARDARIDAYDFYAEQEGDDYRSAVWVDEASCAMAVLWVGTESERVIAEVCRAR